jgi:hypothetical protein
MQLTIIVVFLSCASTDEPFMATLSSSDREAAIKEQFHQAASEALRETGAVLDREAADELRLVWQMAARRLVEDDASPVDVGRAVANVRRIVIAAAGRTPVGGVTREITFRNLENARYSLCPLYPFC